MTAAERILTAVQALSLFTLVAVLLRPAARRSQLARLPVALVVFVSSAAHLFLRIL